VHRHRGGIRDVLRRVGLALTLALGSAPLVVAQESRAADAPDAAGTGAARPLVVGSKAFTESRILAHMIGLLVEERLGAPVTVRDGLGGTLITFEALRAGEIDLYPEYTGTGWAVVL
jgi:glycine betaine/choline ABC-type transport system substrate-binding protein